MLVGSKTCKERGREKNSAQHPPMPRLNNGQEGFRDIASSIKHDKLKDLILTHLA